MLLKRRIEISSAEYDYTSCINVLCGWRLLLEIQFSYLQAGKS